MNGNDQDYLDPNSARAQETIQMDQISPRVTHNQPLAPGDYEGSGYLNDAEIREIRAQELIRRSEHKTSRTCCYGLETIVCVFLFFLVPFYICEAII